MRPALSALRRCYWAAQAPVTCGAYQCANQSRQYSVTQDDLYRAPNTYPGRVHGVQLQSIAGKGRGVVAAAALQPGDLLLVAEPAAIVLGPEDEPPDAELLPPLLIQAASQSGHISAALHTLFTGSAGSVGALPSLERLARLGPHANTSEGADTTSNPTSAADSAAITAAQAAAVVRWNAFGDDYEDLAAARAAGRSPTSQVGVWPAFAMFNHSCDPNAVHYVAGDRMVVRAAQDIAAGQEVTVSYMGREQLAPLGARQAVLEEGYTFTCTCPRCTAEGAVPPPLQQLVDEAYIHVQQVLKPQLMQAVQQSDSQQLQQVREELLELDNRVQQALQQPQAAPPVMTQRQRRAAELLGAGPGPKLLDSQTMTYLQAGLYELHELLLVCGSIDGHGSASEQLHDRLTALARCFEPISWVCRGDELHVYLACQLLQVSEELRGADSSAAVLAQDLLQAAMSVRYGSQLSPSLLQDLLQANCNLAEEFLPMS